EERICPAIDPDEHRLEVADVRANDPEIPLVAGAAGNNERMAVAKTRLQRRGVDPPGEEPPLLAQVAKRVVGEGFERLRDAPALFRDRTRELVCRERAARGDAVAVPKDARPTDCEEVALGDVVEDRRARRIDQADASANEQERAGIRKAPALRGR